MEAIGGILRDAKCTRGKSSISAVAKSVSSDLNGGRRITALSEICPGDISQQCYCAFPCLPKDRQVAKPSNSHEWKRKPWLRFD